MASVIVKPETVLRWHRQGYKAYWRWRSRPRPGRPTTQPRWNCDVSYILVVMALGAQYA